MTRWWCETAIWLAGDVALDDETTGRYDVHVGVAKAFDLLVAGS